MDKYKLDLYQMETGKCFPEFKVLNETERFKILQELYQTIKSTIPKNHLFKTVMHVLNFQDYSIEDTYRITEIFEDLNFPFDNDIYVFWDEKKIDSFKTEDLTRLWQNIWFGE